MEATKCANGHDQSEKNDQVAEDRYGGDLLAPFNNLANISTDDIITSNKTPVFCYFLIHIKY